MISVDISRINDFKNISQNPWQEFFKDNELRKIIRQDVERTLVNKLRYLFLYILILNTLIILDFQIINIFALPQVKVDYLISFLFIVK